MTIDASLATAIHITMLRRAGALEDHSPEAMFEVSTLEALLDGQYEGDFTIGELSKHGDFGIGTFRSLDGELIAVDGEYWRASGAGLLSKANPKTATPFAVMVNFEITDQIKISDCKSFAEMSAKLSNADGESNCVAVRVDGVFSQLILSCAQHQDAPYRVLSEALKDSPRAVLNDIEGSIIGFGFDLPGLQMPGFHFHFLSADRTRGGHVQDVSIVDEVTASFDNFNELHLEIPKGLDFPKSSLVGSKLKTLQNLEGS